MGTGTYGSAGIQTELVTNDFSSEVKMSNYSIANQNNKSANGGLFMQSPTTGHYLGLRAWTDESGNKSVILQDSSLPTITKMSQTLIPLGLNYKEWGHKQWGI